MTIKNLIKSLEQFDNKFLEVQVQVNFKLYEINFLHLAPGKLIIRVKEDAKLYE